METSNAASNDANEKYDLFISYEWDSKTEIAQFHSKLEEKDKSLRVWRDSRLESNNKSLYLQLGQKISRSRVFLFILKFLIFYFWHLMKFFSLMIEIFSLMIKIFSLMIKIFSFSIKSIWLIQISLDHKNMIIKKKYLVKLNILLKEFLVLIL